MTVQGAAASPGSLLGSLLVIMSACWDQITAKQPVALHVQCALHKPYHTSSGALGGGGSGLGGPGQSLPWCLFSMNLLVNSPPQPPGPPQVKTRPARTMVGPKSANHRTGALRIAARTEVADAASPVLIHNHDDKSGRIVKVNFSGAELILCSDFPVWY
jgi:hypothetical protein